jgi:hypothetical protein
MKSIAYPEGWFYVERAAVIMFGLQSQLAPKLNGIQIGFPYITQFMFERSAKRMAAAAAASPPAAPAVIAAAPAAEPKADKPTAAAAGESKPRTDEHEAFN